MLPGVGVSEYIVIAILALVVIGPKDLPMLMRKAGAFLNRLRGMAAEFRASFDEMARQSELDELRKQVEELRSGQLMQPLSAEIAPALTEIESDIRAGVSTDWSGLPAELPPEPKPKPRPKKGRAANGAATAKPAAPRKPAKAAAKPRARKETRS
jgi:sec-independent protein translocase protein TatB